MEPFNTVLHEVIRERVHKMQVDELQLALLFIAAEKPALVVRILDRVGDTFYSESDPLLDS